MGLGPCRNLQRGAKWGEEDYVGGLGTCASVSCRTFGRVTHVFFQIRALSAIPLPLHLPVPVVEPCRTGSALPRLQESGVCDRHRGIRSPRTPTRAISTCARDVGKVLPDTPSACMCGGPPRWTLHGRALSARSQRPFSCCAGWRATAWTPPSRRGRAQRQGLGRGGADLGALATCAHRSPRGGLIARARPS